MTFLAEAEAVENAASMQTILDDLVAFCNRKRGWESCQPRKTKKIRQKLVGWQSPPARYEQSLRPKKQRAHQTCALRWQKSRNSPPPGVWTDEKKPSSRSPEPWKDMNTLWSVAPRPWEDVGSQEKNDQHW